jgi:hypothetical protein
MSSYQASSTVSKSVLHVGRCDRVVTVTSGGDGFLSACVESTMAVDLPSLGAVTQSLKCLTRELSGLSIKTSSQVYTAAVGLLCHLQVDQFSLQDSRCVYPVLNTKFRDLNLKYFCGAFFVSYRSSHKFETADLQSTDALQALFIVRLQIGSLQ